IVLIPSQLVVEQPELPQAPQDQQTTFSVERIPDTETETDGAVVPRRSQEDGGGPHTGSRPAPLPPRVRQANLVPQLRRPDPPEARQRPAPLEPGDSTAGSAALLASFKAGWERAEQESE